MSPELFCEVAEALFGRRWRDDLANALGVSERSVRRWKAGAEIPDGIRAELRKMLLERSAEIAELAKRID